MTERQYESRKELRKAQDRKKGKKTAKVLCIVVAVLVVMGIGVGYYAGTLVRGAASDPSKILSAATIAPAPTAAVIPTPEPAATVEPEQEEVPFDDDTIFPGVKVTPKADSDALIYELLDEGYEFNSDIVPIAFFGIDVWSDRPKMANGESVSGYRSDAILIGAVNIKDKTVKMLSIPRDTWTVVQTLTKDGEVDGYMNNKINTAFAVGGGRDKYSYKNALDAVSYVLGGMPISMYVGFDMDGVQKIVDAVGGVKITVDYDFSAWNMGIEKGKTAVLDGRQALIYVHARHAVPNGRGDLGRMERQRYFVEQFMKTLKSKNAITYVPQLYAAVDEYVDTNLTLEQMVALGTVVDGMDFSTITGQTLPGKVSSYNKLSIYAYDEDSIEDILLDMFLIKK